MSSYASLIVYTMYLMMRFKSINWRRIELVY